ncbi:ATP-binding protein [Derxia gummosa]|uniref:ATP-binding protein n=1 Tax=Derxia gummosa DSM 723 TaxID=1121388 RepID=A0A8B6X7W2_9BURK|nr:ATP-binding protein [Derxia gummosa]
MSTGADRLAANAAALARELDWLDASLNARLERHFAAAGEPLPEPAGHAPPAASPVPGATSGAATTVTGNPIVPWPLDLLPAPPALTPGSDHAELVTRLALGPVERLVLALALAPHLRPQLLDTLFLRNSTLDRGFSEFGGWKGKLHGGFLPTCETAAFLVAGDDLAARLALRQQLDDDAPLRREGVLRIEHDAPGEPFFSAPLRIADEYLDLLTLGRRHKPDFSAGFPAHRLDSPFDWADLVLAPETMAEIDAIRTWLARGAELLDDWRLRKALKPGYRSLFYGPPGTGKTLTATLLGKATGTDVYRIDLSMVVSKYIGETEKNLAHVFDQAENRRWILFFDEADALFGKRTATSSSNDRHANQEVAYLLQRVEDFPGTVILATNLRSNIDDAFARRFQSLIHFPMPDVDQRLRLWESVLRPTGRLADDVDLRRLAEAHELAGGAIGNVVRYAAIGALQAGRDRLTAADLERGVAKEMRKEGRTR